MSRLSTLASFLLSIPLLAGPLSLVAAAQAPKGVIADVPFEFSVNNQRLAAGPYLVLLNSSGFLLLRNISTGKSQFLMMFPESTNTIQSQGRLIFHRYGSSHYLSQVWIPGTTEYRRCVQSRSERQTILAAKSASQAKVEVALKSPTK
ncbi:hypothetical protein [Edaphobacter aggregans]|uniref:hypothetical protein n=1 Tax=Edaphobacter aggregans TaxID=570835 RepID=UPI000552D1B2|nr:hypothetical protein [Edaphobacter aggregans]